jgi:uncharacterized membrane-anchored protein YjiN (DUF445 family)
MIGGLAFTEVGIHMGLFQGCAWGIVASGFEGGTVGGLADWFAVSALFREIPIPVVRRHTNIIVKNRHKLTEGVVDLVANKWLSPEVIREKLSGVPMAEAFLKMLQERRNQARAIDFLRDFLTRIADNLDKPQVASLLQRILKDQIAGIDIATPFGRWLQTAIRRGDHDPVWEMMLDAAAQALDEQQVRVYLRAKLERVFQEYENQDWKKKAALWIGKVTGGVDPEAFTDRLLDKARMFVAEAKANPAHPFRQKFDHSMLAFADRLAARDPESQKLIDHLIRTLIESTDAQGIIRGILSRFKSTVIDELKNNDTPLMSLLIGNLRRLLNDLEAGSAAQRRIDGWMRETITQLVDNYHHEIGNMVRSSLFKLDDAGLVNQIEEKVGDDLQFIRLNGAVIGGLAGVVLAVIKLLIFRS